MKVRAATRTSESRALQAEEAAHAKAGGIQGTATSDSQAFGLSGWPAGVAVPEIWKKLQGKLGGVSGISTGNVRPGVPFAIRQPSEGVE